MKRLFSISFVLLALLLAGTAAEAQFTIDESAMQALLVNSTRTSHSMTYGPPPTVDLGTASGSSQVFDFSVLTGETSKVSINQDFVDPAGKPGASEFPGANFCALTVIDSLGLTFTFASYFKLQSDGFYLLGEYTLIDFPTPFPPDQILIEKHSPPQLFIPLPLGYPTSRTAVDTLTTNSGQDEYTVTTTSISCDGFGDITFPSVLAAGVVPMTPAATPCLRATQTTVEEDYSSGSFVERRKAVSVSYITANGTLLMVKQDDTSYTGGSASVTSVDYSIQEGTTGVRQVSPLLPDGFALSQNYPNPFNPSTTIGFSVPAAGYVTLRVYDLLGREVAVLVDRQMTPGSYETTFDAGDLPSGMYVCRLVSGRHVETRKMNIVK